MVFSQDGASLLESEFAIENHIDYRSILTQERGQKLNLNDNLLWSATGATLGGTFSKRNHATFQENKNRNQWFEIEWTVLMAAWLDPT